MRKGWVVVAVAAAVSLAVTTSGCGPRTTKEQLVVAIGESDRSIKKTEEQIKCACAAGDAAAEQACRHEKEAEKSKDESKRVLAAQCRVEAHKHFQAAKRLTEILQEYTLKRSELRGALAELEGAIAEAALEQQSKEWDTLLESVAQTIRALANRLKGEDAKRVLEVMEHVNQLRKK